MQYFVNIICNIEGKKTLNLALLSFKQNKINKKSNCCRLFLRFYLLRHVCLVTIASIFHQLLTIRSLPNLIHILRAGENAFFLYSKLGPAPRAGHQPSTFVLNLIRSLPNLVHILRASQKTFFDNRNQGRLEGPASSPRHLYQISFDRYQILRTYL